LLGLATAAMGAPVIGLAGGIGAGKSTVATMLAERGAHVIDADRVGHDVYRVGTEGFRQVTEAFGTRVVAPDGTIDRRALGGIVFGDPRALARLNAILHPLIVAELGRRIAAARRASVSRPIVVEAAILAEAGWRTLFDRLWVVTARPENAIARVVTSRGMAREAEERGRTGIALAAVEQRLAVGAVDEDSAAASAGLRVGDTVLQVNGTVPRACADYGRTVREAEHERKALLVLVRRGDAELPLALGARTWERVPPAVPPAPRAEAPSVRAMVEKPAPPLPPESQVTLEELTRAFAALVPPERPPARLANYQHDLLKLHRQTEALAARAAVPSEVAAGLRTVLRYYDAAEVAWAAQEA